jgi:uncharacterized protein DUF3604
VADAGAADVTRTERTRLILTGGFLLVALALTIRAGQPPAGGTAFHPRPPRISPGEADGRAELLPNRIGAGAIGAYELRVTLGERGIPTRGSMLVSLPKAWFTNPFPIPKRLQWSDPARPHFLAVRMSRPGATFMLGVDNVGFTGKIERFNQTISIVNTGAPLEPGDVISVKLSNTTAPYVAGPDAVRVAIDSAGAGRYVAFKQGASYVVTPGPAEEFTLTAPTEAVVRRPVSLKFTAFDRFANVVSDFKGRVRLSPGSPWTPTKEGFFFPEAAVEAGGTSVIVRGNPVRVFAREPAVKTFWGELHSHSSISADGIGNDPFTYARDAAALDFYASTEHADDDGSPRANAIRPEDWAQIKKNVGEFNAPGRFVTLLAYECSFPAPSGHHNVFFRGVEGEPWPVALMGSVQNLWAKIRAGDAITIPHHTGIIWSGATAEQQSAGPDLQPILTAARGPITSAGASVDWSIHDPIRRPLLEIYSLHGTSEMYDPADPLAYENAHFTFARSVPGAHYARDAWAEGLELGVVAATDNHTAHPGQPEGGVTAIRAPQLSRDAVFDALAGKHTYATTGQRMYMDATIAGVGMGQRGRARVPVDGTIVVAAPSPIASAEMMRYDFASRQYVVAERWEKADRVLEAKFKDSPQGDRVMYYLRVQLEEPVRVRVVRGWTSPIWLTLSPTGGSHVH